MRTKIFLLLCFCILCYACSKKTLTENSGLANLIPADTLRFPIDDSTYYESKAMFQFEDKNKEYLFFQTSWHRGILRIIIFDIEKQSVHKSVPLYQEGPNGLPRIMGGFPLDMNRFLITTDANRIYQINDEGEILSSSAELFSEHNHYVDYCSTIFYSYYSNPAILRDSLLYFPQNHIGYPHTKETWGTSNIFSYTNLNTGTLGKTSFCYPAEFDGEEITRTISYNAAHSYADTGKEVAVSFESCDSIYVSADFQHVRAYNAKSRYFPHLHPTPYNAAQDLTIWLRKENKKPTYHHLLYDKYRKVFYRFARFPYEFPIDRNPMGEDSGRQFSIIILNKDYEIIGETRFPGNTYAYRLWFIGKDGLYLSLNNQGNADFDEDQLLFQRMKLEYKK